MPCRKIANGEGVHPTLVNNATNAVLKDDIKTSGESEASVREGYW